jgi:hypothetical protein
MSKVYKNVDANTITYTDSILNASTQKTEADIVAEIGSEGYYKFGSGSTIDDDSSGNGRNGSVIDVSSASNIQGLSDQITREAVGDFSLSSSSVLILSSHAAIFRSFDNFACSFWIRYTEGVGTGKNLISGYADSNNYLVLEYFSNGTLRFIRRLLSIDEVLVSKMSMNLDDGNWHHIVGQTGTAGGKLYVDGILVAEDNTKTDSFSVFTSPQLSQFVAGGLNETTSLDNKFYMDSLVIFNKVLSKREVQDLYRYGFVETLADQFQNIDSHYTKIDTLNCSQVNISNIDGVFSNTLDVDNNILAVNSITSYTEDHININHNKLYFENDQQTGAPANGINGSATGQRLILSPGDASNTPYGLGINSFDFWSAVPSTARFEWYSGTDLRLQLNGSNGTLKTIISDLGYIANQTLGGAVNCGISIVRENPTPSIRYDFLVRGSDLRWEQDSKKIWDYQPSRDRLLSETRWIISPNNRDGYVNTTGKPNITSIPACSVYPQAAAGNGDIGTNYNTIAVNISGILSDWGITPNASNDLTFQYKGSSGSYVERGYIQDGVFIDNINFTGQHRCCPQSSFSIKVGYIVSSTGKYCDSITDENELTKLVYGRDSLQINSALPIIEYSSSAEDPRVFGVISDSEDPNEEIHRYLQGVWGSSIAKVDGDNRIIINSLGEGAIWVSDIGGNLQIGDYITSSSIPGIGMRQSDDLIHNYTVAKISMSCNFSGGVAPNADYEIKWIDLAGNEITETDYQTQGGHKMAFVACTYHCG